MPLKTNPRILEKLRRLLCDLQNHIRDAVAGARSAQAKSFAKIAAVTQADTIYQIDRISEAAILDWFGKNWPITMPVELVMEGIEDGETVTYPPSTPVQKTAWNCILDPIVGTRCLL